MIIPVKYTVSRGAVMVLVYWVRSNDGLEGGDECDDVEIYRSTTSQWYQGVMGGIEAA